MGLLIRDDNNTEFLHHECVVSEHELDVLVGPTEREVCLSRLVTLRQLILEDSLETLKVLGFQLSFEQVFLAFNLGRCYVRHRVPFSKSRREQTTTRAFRCSTS